MSNPYPPLAFSRSLPPRPAVVTAAVIVMLTTAVLGLTVALVSVLGMHAFNDAFRRDVAPFSPPRQLVDTTEATGRVVFVSLAVVALICAIVTGVLAFGVLRANTGARVGAWLMSALGVISALITITGAVLVRVTFEAHNVDEQTAVTAAAIRSAQDSVPSWCSGLIGSLSGVVALGYIAAAILLAVPAAKMYFGRIIEPWQLPVEMATEPAGSSAPHIRE